MPGEPRTLPEHPEESQWYGWTGLESWGAEGARQASMEGLAASVWHTRSISHICSKAMVGLGLTGSLMVSQTKWFTWCGSPQLSW